MANNNAESEVNIYDLEVDDNYDQLLDSFNEMDQEAQKLSVANNLLKGKVRHVDKLVEIQKKLLEERAKKMKFWKKKRTTLLVIALIQLMSSILVKHQRIKKVKFGYYIPLQLEEASKGIALIPNFRFINFSLSLPFSIFGIMLSLWIPPLVASTIYDCFGGLPLFTASDTSYTVYGLETAFFI